MIPRIFLLITLSLLSLSLQAQEYIFEFKVDYKLHRSRRRYYNNVFYTLSDGTRKAIDSWHFWQQTGDFGRQGRLTFSAKQGPIIKLETQTFWQKKKKLYWVSDSYGQEWNTFYHGQETEFSLPKAYLGDVVTTSGDVSYDIHYIRMYPDLTFVGIQPRLFPWSDKIVIQNQAGFPRSVYKWQYSTDGGNTWLAVPSSIIDSSPSGSLQISGQDLMGEQSFHDFVAHGRNVQFRIYNPIKSSATISLQAVLSTPHIDSHTAQQERCHQSHDASISIKLNRALLPDERLAYSITSSGWSKTDNVEALDADNQFAIQELPPGSYTVKLLGSYHGYASYALAPSHTLTTTILERPAIDYSFTKKDVSCYGGFDGSITLTASGGTGRFTAHLFDASGAEVRTQDFTSTTAISRIPSGKYTLKVYDSNNCSARQRNGEEIIHTIILSEPSEAVTAEQGHLISPLAHDSSDGSISVRATGGTPLSNGYQVSFVRRADGQRFSPSSVRPDGDGYIYTLTGIPRGVYTAVVEDARYEALAPEDKNAPCGCRAELDITLTAPPPLEVQIEETHFVSCHGDSNGEITAHAKGGKPSTSARLPYTYTWHRLTDSTRERLALQTDSIARGLIAGKYQVQVTDANGISVLSAPFTLVQPEPLALRFNISSPNCSGGSGKVEALVTGGTAPYTYEWNKEGETSPMLQVSEVGIYFLRATDSRGCSVEGTAEVIAPDALSVKSDLVHPTCYGSDNGSISLSISGGRAPYTIRWEDQPSLASSSRSNLPAGDYLAVVSDALGCTLRYRFTLTEPKALKVTLSEAFTLCKDQSRSLVASASEDEATYQWQRNGQRLQETSRELLVSKAGCYEVIATGKNGCSASASVVIKDSQTELPIDITAPSSAHAGTEIHVVNISRIKADRLKWHLPLGAVVSSQSEDRLVFSMPMPGSYSVALEGFLGDCSSIVRQSIEVLPSGGVVLPDAKGEPLIRQFLVTPTPTTGEFKVLVELGEPQDFTLRLLSPSGVEMDRKLIHQTKTQTFEYELRGDVAGVYRVELRVGAERSVLKVQKQKK